MSLVAFHLPMIIYRVCRFTVKRILLTQLKWEFFCLNGSQVARQDRNHLPSGMRLFTVLYTQSGLVVGTTMVLV